MRLLYNYTYKMATAGPLQNTGVQKLMRCTRGLQEQISDALRSFRG